MAVVMRRQVARGAHRAPGVVAPWHGLVRASRRVVGIATTAVVVVAFFGLVVLGIGPRTGRYRVLTVQSGSMRPALPVGSLIVVTPMPLSHVRAGDIITFHMPTNHDLLETHRVVQVLQPGLHPVVRTKGDANSTADPWRLRLLTEPAWRVRAVMPGLGAALAWLRGPLAHLLTALGAPLLLGALWVSEIWCPRGATSRHRPQPRLAGG